MSEAQDKLLQGEMNMTLNMTMMTSARDAVGKCLATLGGEYDNMLVLTADVDTSSRIQVDPAQGGGAAQSVPIGTDVGEQEEVVPFPQPLSRSLYRHTSSSASGRCAAGSELGPTGGSFSMSPRMPMMRLPWSMESSGVKISSGVYRRVIRLASSRRR